SMFITNLNYNAIDNNDGGGDYLYLTGENLISETLERLYCCITGTPHLEMVSKVLNDSDFNLKVEIKNTLTAKRSNIILKYFKSQRTTTADIRDYVDEAASGGRLKAVYLDYLDLLKSESRLEDTRLDLGEACNELKNIAIDYALPIISPTQLNKSGYDTELVPKLTSMSESMKKVDNSDFVLFLQPAPDPIITLNINGIPTVCKKVRMTILKNRNGETGESVFLIAPVRAGNIKIFNYRMLELTKFVKDINPNMVNDSNSPWD
ncbi:MAG: DnaB-like helicase C-terminal domain-containing protein, partial [Chloroflexota bacterium]|nr:DnaB-like helicase C-terminal domain-containing protein [Chloroflexota bacterium]